MRMAASCYNFSLQLQEFESVFCCVLGFAKLITDPLIKRNKFLQTSTVGSSLIFEDTGRAGFDRVVAFMMFLDVVLLRFGVA